MKVVVFGASGGTGRAAVWQALEDGHDVTAFARAPAAVDLRHERLQFVAGDVLDAAAVKRAVAGRDAVIVALGASAAPPPSRPARGATPAKVCSAGTRHVIAAMRAAGSRRLVCVSAYGVGETRDRVPAPFKLTFRTLQKDQLEDKEVQEQIVRDSGLDWVIVQPVGLTNSAAKRQFLASPEGKTKSTTIARADVAAFCVEQLADDDYLRMSVTLSG
jgi:nucleoside-diphosphate-sugar epimerase